MSLKSLIFEINGKQKNIAGTSDFFEKGEKEFRIALLNTTGEFD